MSEDKNKKKKKNRVLDAILTVIIFILVAAIALVAVNLYQDKKDAAEDAAQQTQTPVVREVEEDSEDFPVPDKDIDWDSLLAENPDVYAWIYVPGTEVDYPVLQHPTENDYYLMHNLDGSSGYPGCIYSQCQYNSTDFTDRNLILYGHNMKNGSMFSSLHDYEDQDFFDENRYIYVYTPDCNYVYDIFAAYTFTNALLPEKYDFETTEGFADYLAMVLAVDNANSHFDTEAESYLSDDSQIITLSTCIANMESNRWLVQGVMVAKESN